MPDDQITNRRYRQSPWFLHVPLCILLMDKEPWYLWENSYHTHCIRNFSLKQYYMSSIQIHLTYQGHCFQWEIKSNIQCSFSKSYFSLWGYTVLYSKMESTGTCRTKKVKNFPLLGRALLNSDYACLSQEEEKNRSEYYRWGKWH